MFVNLARRSQILVDRLIGHLDRLERGEEDPDRLAELFQLDHLATRMRRNDENLLVLAGADSTRIQREPAPLMDVLRAAQSEVEHYTRIEFGMIDRDIEIAAHAVNDMVHLVAELLDNATAFSPPDSAVIVEARRVGDRSVLLVEDHGIGVSPEQLAELNDRLANPPMVDVAVSRMMGLVVVARLAARHGVKVELRPARERGTIADVTLPAGVLVPRALAGRAAAGMPSAGMPMAGSHEVPSRPSTPTPRSPLAAPLALESGPTGGRGGYGPQTGGGFGGPQTGGGFSGFGAPADGGGFGGTLASSGLFGGGNDRRGNDRMGAGHSGYANGTTPTSPPPPPGGPGQGPGQGPGPGLGQGPGQGPSRGLPAWSDLTGINGNGHDVRTPQPPQGFTDPLPQRRSGDSWGFDNGTPGDFATGRPVEPDQGGAIPRQRPEVPEARAAEAPPAVPSPAAPPSWPPVSGAPAPHAPDQPYDTRDQPAEAYPVDRTAEIPRVRLDWEPSQPEGEVAEGRQRYVDETMELPIYQELESAWFRTRRPGHDQAPTQSTININGGPTTQPTVSDAGYGPASAPAEVTYSDPPRVPYAQPEAPAPMPVAETRQPSAERATAGPAVSWQTAADEGWQAAAALAKDQEFAVTDTGLPKRVPMSQLVPGGVEKNVTSAHRRTPESVRGLLSAYHRGVQRGRTRSDDPKTPERTSTGPQNSQGGKEQEA
jgi:hypothetical protein